MNNPNNMFCRSCKHTTQRSLSTRGGQGSKLKLDQVKLVQKLKQPRNLDQQPLNIYEFIKELNHRKNNNTPQHTNYQAQESRIQTQHTKHRTEQQEHHWAKQEDETARLMELQTPVQSSRFRAEPKNNNSAFYKMKQMSLRKLTTPKNTKLNIGPIFNQVSKYVSTARPITTHFSSNKQYYTELEDVIKPVRLASSQSEAFFKHINQPKHCLVQTLMMKFK